MAIEVKFSCESEATGRIDWSPTPALAAEMQGGHKNKEQNRKAVEHLMDRFATSLSLLFCLKGGIRDDAGENLSNLLNSYNEDLSTLIKSTLRKAPNSN
jgi:phosphoheptose isomerase